MPMVWAFTQYMIATVFGDTSDNIEKVNQSTLSFSVFLQHYGLANN